MRAELIKQQEYLDRFLKIGIGYKETLARYRAYNTFVLQFLINPFNGIARGIQRETQVVDRGEHVIFNNITAFYTSDDRIRQLQVFGCDRVLVYR